ncbi:MAG: hypothetical protein KBT06_04380 [Prevotellaceae bacterium]|nr:hypothetical protein [Candidatus Colivivens equi]
MTKKEKEMIEEQKTNFELKYSSEMIGLIVAQYIYLGEQIIAQITDDLLKQKLKELKKQEKEAKKHNQYMIIEPQMQIDIVKGCIELYHLDRNARLDIIKETL